LQIELQLDLKKILKLLHSNKTNKQESKQASKQAEKQTGTTLKLLLIKCDASSGWSVEQKQNLAEKRKQVDV
jgi:hypothetical protein